MKNLRYDTAKIFLGFAETLNPNAGINENQTPPKVVVLHKDGVNQKPIKEYEYHYCKRIVPIASYMDPKEISWHITTNKINEIIARTGIEEANVIDTDNAKVVKRVA